MNNAYVLRWPNGLTLALGIYGLQVFVLAPLIVGAK